MVEDVIALEPEFEFGPLRQFRLLGEVHIEVHESGSINVVAADVAGTAEGRGRKRRRVEIRLETGLASDPTEGIRIADLVAPGGDTRSLAVSTATDFEGMPGLRSRNPRELHAFEDFPQHAAVEVTLAPAQRYLPDVVDHRHVPDVVIRVSPILIEVAGVARERAIALGGTLSAEHGIGKLKRDYLRLLYSDEHLREMAALKRAFDPAGILGRGNVFSESLLSP